MSGYYGSYGGNYGGYHDHPIPYHEIVSPWFRPSGFAPGERESLYRERKAQGK